MTARILVIDDDVVDRMAVRRALRAGGLEFELDEASTCKEGLDLLVKRPYACVFLDYLLPDGTGLSVIEAARAQGLRCPIVVLTGQGDERTAVELMKAGATDYAPKAEATPERIAHLLRTALRVAQAEQAAQHADQERAFAMRQELAARDDALAAHGRLAFLAEASNIVSSSLDYAETLANVARLAVPSLADWCFVDLAERDTSFERVAVAHADPSKADLAARLRRRYDPIKDVPHGVGRVLGTGNSEVLTDIPEWLLVAIARDGEHLAMLRELGIASAMIVPLAARGRALGAMTFLSAQPLRYTPEDLAFGEEIARRAALAVDNARLYADVRHGEEKLRRQLDFTTAITGSLAEGVCALDLEGRVIFANPAAEQLLGHAPGTMLARPVESLLPKGAPGLLAAMRQGNVLQLEEHTFLRADGSGVPVALIASPIATDGEVTGAVLAFHDVSSRKRAEAELEASRRQLALTEKLTALGTLVSGVAHELRTPLTYLSNNLFLLQARLETAAREDPSLAGLVGDVKRYSASALEGADRINALLRDLRPFAQSERGRKAPAGLHEVVAGGVDLFRATQRGRIEVIADLQPTPPLRLDASGVQRVVINLLLNAAEAMPRGGRVLVSTRATATGALLEVIDGGTGMTPDVEARMFDPFFTTKADGTGLGLAITRRVVEAHGGVIRHETSPAGTRFVIELPLGNAAVVAESVTVGPRLPAA